MDIETGSCDLLSPTYEELQNSLSMDYRDWWRNQHHFVIYRLVSNIRRTLVDN